MRTLALAIAAVLLSAACAASIRNHQDVKDRPRHYLPPQPMDASADETLVVKPPQEIYALLQKAYDETEESETWQEEVAARFNAMAPAGWRLRASYDARVYALLPCRAKCSCPVWLLTLNEKQRWSVFLEKDEEPYICGSGATAPINLQ